MNDYNVEGVSKINGGVFGRMRVDGVGTCTDDVKADEMLINGVFKCLGAVEAGLLETEGTAEFRSNIRAKRLVVDGVLTVKADGKIKSEQITCNGVITVRGNGIIEADDIKCDGVITANEISADVIYADGVINAKEITGDKITIRSRNHTIDKIARFFWKRFSNVELIEATTIDLRGVIAKSVNGRDIVIGPGCSIDTLDCSGTLIIDKTAEVRNITGEYTKDN